MKVFGNGLCCMCFAGMSEPGVVPRDDFWLEQLGSDDSIIKVANQSVAGNLGLVLLVGMGEVSELSISLLMSADHVEGEREGAVIFIVTCKAFIAKIKFVGRWFSKELVTEKIGHNIFGAGKINHFWSIFLNNQPPVADTIGVEIQKGKILVIHVDADNMS